MLWELWINNKKVGFHHGGYDPFSFNITPYLKAGKQKLELRVWDPTNDGFQLTGKQVKNPGGIWYTPVSGIWQTVWLEPVHKNHITNLKITSDIDNSNKPLKSNQTATNRVDINVLKSKLQETESKEFKKNAYILSSLVLGLGILGIYLSL